MFMLYNQIFSYIDSRETFNKWTTFAGTCVLSFVSVYTYAYYSSANFSVSTFYGMTSIQFILTIAMWIHIIVRIIKDRCCCAYKDSDDEHSEITQKSPIDNDTKDTTTHEV